MRDEVDDGQRRRRRSGKTGLGCSASVSGRGYGLTADIESRHKFTHSNQKSGILAGGVLMNTT
jgi:hypothetical protein